MTSHRCPLILTKCGMCYTNFCSAVAFAFNGTHGKCKFSTGSVQRKRSHYDVLGLSPKATQVDVKAAYYNLSKIYHPDRNKGSAEAAEKFRDITAAYEVLGNFNLRRLYDKGIIHTAGPQYQDVEETVDVKDDAQTQFYKRHMKRTQTPHASGRTPIYNFDEWNDAHYGKAFERSQEARKRFNTKLATTSRHMNEVKYEVTILGGIFIIAVVVYLMVRFDETSQDAIDTASTKMR